MSNYLFCPFASDYAYSLKLCGLSSCQNIGNATKNQRRFFKYRHTQPTDISVLCQTAAGVRHTKERCRLTARLRPLLRERRAKQSNSTFCFNSKLKIIPSASNVIASLSSGFARKSGGAG